MAEDFEAVAGKSATDLGVEALWFLVHTVLAVLIAGLVVGAFWAAKVNPDSAQPKLLCTAVVILAAMVVGFLTAKSMRNTIGQYVWLAGLLTFGILCVYVLDLPTGPGLCNGCGALDKLSRTFFSFQNGSGLMSGNGLLGLWATLAMTAYAIGANFGAPKEEF